MLVKLVCLLVVLVISNLLDKNQTIRFPNLSLLSIGLFSVFFPLCFVQFSRAMFFHTVEVLVLGSGKMSMKACHFQLLNYLPDPTRSSQTNWFLLFFIVHRYLVADLESMNLVGKVARNEESLYL